MIKKIITALCYMMKVKRVSPKSSHHKAKTFFSVSLTFYLYKMMDAH